MSHITTKGICVVVIGLRLLIASDTLFAEIPQGVAIPVESLGSETLSSGFLSYYFKERRLMFFSPLYLTKAFGVSDKDREKDLGALAPLYLSSLATSTYLTGGMLGDDGSLSGAFVGAWALPLTLPFLTTVPVLGWGDESLINSTFEFGWELGVALAPISSAIGYRNLFPELTSAKKEDTMEVITAEMVSADYGLALAEMGLARLGIGLRNGLDNRRLLPIWSTTTTLASSLAVYSTGELNGSGKGSLHGTLLSGFAAPIIGAQVGALIGNGENMGACVGVFGSNLTATLGYNLFQTDKDNIDTASVIGGYYGSAAVGIALNRIGMKEHLPKKTFSFLKATSMAIGSSSVVYGMGERWGSGEGNFARVLAGGIAAPVGYSFIPPYFGADSGMNEFYRAGAGLSPITAMLAYDQIHINKDNIDTAEVIGGYYGSAAVAAGLNRIGVKKHFKREAFSLLEASSMAVASSVVVYGMGKRWGSGESNLAHALVGGIAAPAVSALIPPYFGENSLMDEFYRVGARFSPLTAMLAQNQFPYDDFQEDADNISMEAAEIAGGYVGSSIVAIGLNRLGIDLKSALSDWKLSLIRGTTMALASSLSVYLVGESFGSGKGKFSDAFVGGVATPVGASLVPLSLSLLPLLGGEADNARTIFNGWNEFYLIGSFLAPIWATLKYNDGISDSQGTKVTIPMFQMSF